MPPRNNPPPPNTIDGPYYLNELIERLESGLAEFSEPEEGGDVPLSFSKAWTLTDLSSDREFFFWHFPRSAKRVCDLMASFTDNEDDSCRGTTLYEDRSCLALYRLDWVYTPHKNDPNANYGRLEAVWGLEASTARAILDPLKRRWLLEIAQDVLRPAHQLLQQPDAFREVLSEALQPFLTTQS